MDTILAVDYGARLVFPDAHAGIPHDPYYNLFVPKLSKDPIRAVTHHPLLLFSFEGRNVGAVAANRK